MKNPNPVNMLKLVAKGFRIGQNVNTALIDLATGRFLFRHNSSSDDAARLLDKHLAEDRATRHRDAAVTRRFNQALDQLEKRIQEKDEKG